MINALTIAGSDPSGGAGIQADLRVFAALDVAGLSAVTALTVQNSRGVRAVHPVPPDVLAAQIEGILSDASVQAVKIGMLGDKAQVGAVAEALRRFRPPFVVLDPVLASTGGAPFLDEAGQHALVQDLLPLCSLVTPNLAEASALTSLRADAVETMRAAGERLLASGAQAVLVKGGHLPDEPTDLLLTADGPMRLFTEERVETPHTHGTGCLLSSAIAAHVARGLAWIDAVLAAKRLLAGALRSPVVTGRGRGYPDVFVAARARKAGEDRTHPERLALVRGLYVLTDPDLRPDRMPEEIVRAALAGGARIVQMRDKRQRTPALVERAKRLKEMARAAGALFIVNDRVDVALASGADGVHLGPEDMRPADARRLLGPHKLIGVSVGTVDEALPLAPDASYLGVGAIFGSATKNDAGPPVGPERIRQIKQAFPGHPVVAIGGINGDNIAAVAQAGADAVAVLSAVVCAPDMKKAAAELAGRLGAKPR